MSNFSRPLQVPPLEELEWLQGSPGTDLTHDVQLMLLIQVNCPGCHVHAIPVANELNATKQHDFGVYCVSTAFEEFEWNTLENTRALLRNGQLVGIPKQQLGPTTTTHIPQMPLAYDQVLAREDVPPELLETAIAAAKQNTREQAAGSVHPGVLEKVMHQMTVDQLLPAKIARTFWSVRAMGTPFWVLHRQSTGEVLDRKLGGPQTVDDLLQWIRPHLLENNNN